MGEQRLGELSCKEGFLLEIVFEGIQQLGALYSVWARGSKGVPLELGGRRDLASWQGGKTGSGWLSFRNLGRTLAAGIRQGETASKDINNGGSTSYLQVFFHSLYGNSVYLNIKGFYVVIIPCYLHN